MLMVQVVFVQPYPPPSRGIKTQTVWVDTSWGLKEGDQVTFKGETGRWIVSLVYETVIEHAELDKKWGLDLPKSQRTER